MDEINPADIRRLIDKDAIREATLRYTRGLDRHDWDLLNSAYHPGAKDDHGPYIGDAVGFVDYLRRARQDPDRKWNTQQHYIMNQTIDLDGDTAHAETYYIATMRRKTGIVDNAGGRYADRLERRDGKWAVVDRNCLVEWAGELAKTPETMGSPLFVEAKHDKSDVSYKRPLKVTREHRKG